MLNYAAVAIVGFLLGLLGGGGSTLILPVLVYLVGISAVTATSYSLLIVGVAAAFGAAGYLRKGLVDLRAVVSFGLPSIVGVFLARMLIMPQIPETVFRVDSFELTRRGFILAVFAIMVLASAFSMIRQTNRSLESTETSAPTVWKSIVAGLIVGTSTGFVGAGGGFMIVPALIIFLKMGTRQAIATSLFVIAIKSLVGFCADVFIVAEVEWRLLLQFTSAAVFGILLGVRLNDSVDAERLKVSFGWLILMVGIGILIKEFS